MIHSLGKGTTWKEQLDTVPFLVENLVSHILWSTSQSKRYSPGELLSFLKTFPTLLSKGDAINVAEQMDCLRDELQNRGFGTSFSGSSSDAIDLAERTFSAYRYENLFSSLLFYYLARQLLNNGSVSH